ncbi:MAG: LytTR family DNA-binding domain-containing protein [Spirosomataceae bacterium]
MSFIAMISLLKQPFPQSINTTRQHFFTALGTGLFVSIFLLIFQPFGSGGWQDPHKTLKLVGYGIISFVAVFSVNAFITVSFKKWYSENNWTVGREIIRNIIIIFTIALGNLLYHQWLFKTHFTVRGVVFWIGITALVGLIPVVVLTLLSYVFLLKKHATHQFRLGKNSRQGSFEKTITLIADNEKDTISILKDSLLFIESADNYLEVVYWIENKVQKELLRSSLSRIENQINHSAILRCHRSYIVNLEQVKSVSGNAQGYKLHLHHWDSALPVARRYTNIVKAFFQKIALLFVPKGYQTQL